MASANIFIDTGVVSTITKKTKTVMSNITRETNFSGGSTRKYHKRCK